MRPAGGAAVALAAATLLATLPAAPSAAAGPSPKAAQLRTLRDFVILHGRRKRETLYVGMADVGDGQGPAPYAWWPRDHSLLNLTQFDCCSLSWLERKGRIDLDHDVVATPEDVAGSTYLVDRPWTRAVERSCRRGRRLVVTRPGPRAVRAVRLRYDNP